MEDACCLDRERRGLLVELGDRNLVMYYFCEVAIVTFTPPRFCLCDHLQYGRNGGKPPARAARGNVDEGKFLKTT